ncbi:hypothetical protein QN277_004577 [Acacia crassicarpa]|uniref:Uncharacterized protein n=1 Tax=Acacia crassicarpa TaxID=499986 RepID=A0AAE1J0R4_9FABA|nr:hypothetical protein QN277_004577 [Acacia crassicarpa]
MGGHSNWKSCGGTCNTISHSLESEPKSITRAADICSNTSWIFAVKREKRREQGFKKRNCKKPSLGFRSAYCDAQLPPENLREFLPRLIPVLLSNMVYADDDESIAEAEHASRDGKLEEVVLRHLGVADGNTMIAKDVRLSDFLSNMHLR